MTGRKKQSRAAATALLEMRLDRARAQQSRLIEIIALRFEVRDRRAALLRSGETDRAAEAQLDAEEKDLDAQLGAVVLEIALEGSAPPAGVQ